MTLTICTPSIPARREMLTECIASVAAQTRLPQRHVVSVDYEGLALHAHFNALARHVTTDWMMYLADDDLLDPTYVEVTLKRAEQLGHPAVVWPYNRGGWPGYNQPFTRQLLATTSCVSGAAIFSTELFHAAGGFQPVWGNDWRLWQRMAQNPEVRFEAIPEVLWTYRYHDANISTGGRMDMVIW